MDQIESAYNHIEEEEYSEAQEIAKDLISNGEVEGYFILTDIAHEEENLEECVSVLKQGVEEYSSNWKLWMRLGNYQSDLERFDDAEYSLDRAYYLTGADQSVIKLNKAVLYRRLKNYDKSFELISQTSEDYPINSFSLELDILNELEEYSKIVKLYEKKLFEDDYEHDLDAFSRALFYIAKAHFKLGMRDKAVRHLNDSIDLDRNNKNSLWLRREIFGSRNAKNKYFQILVSGDYEDEETKGIDMEFFTWYDVISESLELALTEIKNFEPLDLDKESFKIEEYEILHESTLDPNGIYQTTGFSVCQKE